MIYFYQTGTIFEHLFYINSISPKKVLEKTFLCEKLFGTLLGVILSKILRNCAEKLSKEKALPMTYYLFGELFWVILTTDFPLKLKKCRKK